MMRDRWKRKGRGKEAEERRVRASGGGAEGKFGSGECLVFQACWIKDI